LQAGLQTYGMSSVLVNQSVQDNARKNSGLQPPGSAFAGLPMQVSPTQMHSNIIGFPLIKPMQQMMWDFQTGTNTDTLYNVIHATHNIQPGKYTTSIEWSPAHSFAVFYTISNQIHRAIADLKKMQG